MLASSTARTSRSCARAGTCRRELEPYVDAGQFIGTTGLGLHLEGMNVGFVNSPVTSTIQANSSVQSIGWFGYKTISSTTLIGATGKET